MRTVVREEEVGEITAIREPYKPLCFVVVLNRRNIQYTVYCIQYTVYSILYTAYVDALQDFWSRLLSICFSNSQGAGKTLNNRELYNLYCSILLGLSNWKINGLGFVARRHYVKVNLSLSRYKDILEEQRYSSTYSEPRL